MHILLIHQAFAALDEPGGTRHHELALYLASQGHKVTVIASPVSYLTGKTNDLRQRWLEKQDGGSGVEILRVFTYAALHRSFVHRMLSFFSFMFSSFITGLGVKGVDLVWGTSPPIFQGFTALVLARLKRKPFMFEVRDLWPAFAVAVGVLRQPLLIRLSEWLERLLYRNADLLIVNSPGFTDHVRERGARRVALVANGADTQMFSPSINGDEFRKNAGLQGKFIALYAGAHGMSNDLDVVLEAAALLRHRADIHIVLLGAGKEKQALLAKAQALGLINVSFLPPLPKTGMPEALAASDACIAILKPIELYKTVYPNKVFDYMAAGRPLALAMDGVIRDVVEQAGAGIVVPPGNAAALAEALCRLSEDPATARQMGMAGRHYVEQHFDRLMIAEQLRKLLEDVFGR